MTTASTRSRSRKKKRGAKSLPARATAEVASKEMPALAISERTWFIAAVGILLVAAVLRLYDLDLVPLHHDEGVNGNFLTRLVREGLYNYDPQNYHGPTLYYFAAFVPWLLRFFFGATAQDKYGLNTITIRLVPALFGLATVWLALLLRRHIGSIGALAAAALLAISPGAVYLSRYFIHETLFVFFTFGIVIAALRFYETAHPVYLTLAAISAALMFATKETAIISLGVLVIALVVTWLYRYMRRSELQERRDKRSSRARDRSPSLLDRLGGPIKVVLLAIIALGVFIGLNVIFYSSFFKNYPEGVYDAVRTFQFWSKTGKTAHVHPLYTYIPWLVRQESPTVLLATIGAAAVMLKPRNSVALFLSLWGFGIFAAYSLISYKTPWLGLNFIVPLALVGGYAVEVIWDKIGKSTLGIAIVLLAIAVSGYQTIDLNFFNYDNDSSYYVYVYAHTRRETLAMLREIDQVVARTGDGTQTGIAIMAPEYWPLPWYFRDFTRVAYNARMTSTTEPLIIASEQQGAEMETTFGERYQQVNSGLNSAGSFALRPGVSLLLYVRRDLVSTAH